MIAMFVDVGNIGLAGCPRDTHVAHVTCSTTQTIRNITNGIRRGKMAEKHTNKVCPTVDSFMMLVALVFLNQFIKNVTVY